MTSASAVETSVSVTTNSSSKDYTRREEHTSPTYDILHVFLLMDVSTCTYVRMFGCCTSRYAHLCNCGSNCRIPWNFLSVSLSKCISELDARIRRYAVKKSCFFSKCISTGSPQ